MQHLPAEIQTRIFSFLDFESAAEYQLINSNFFALSRSPSSRSQLLLNRYGKALVLFSTYFYHPSLLTVKMAEILVRQGAIVNRFLVQRMVTDFYSRDLNPELYIFFIRRSFDCYHDQADFKGNDIKQFELLIRQSSFQGQSSIERLQALITEYNFIPVPGLIKSYLESMYTLSKVDLGLIQLLMRRGLDLESINDYIVDKVLSHPYLTLALLNRYLDTGFILSRVSIKRALALGRLNVMSLLEQVVPHAELVDLAHETLSEMCGPFTSNHSLNVPWSSVVANRLIKTFQISQDHIMKCILTKPQEACTFTENFKHFPVTRPYLKSRPYPVWRWVLDTFGPHHELAVACMDDALSRAVADPELNDVHFLYLEAGFIFRPRHIKILACRVLHPTMSKNAFDLLKCLGQQVFSRIGKQKTLSLDRIVPLGDQISFLEGVGFRKAFLEHVFSLEWRQRVSTIDSNELALKFLDECRRIDDSLNYPTDTDPRLSQDSVHSHEKRKRSFSWSKKIKRWWKKYSLAVRV